MLRMISDPHRPQSGPITCYLNPTYHVLPRMLFQLIDLYKRTGYPFAHVVPSPGARTHPCIVTLPVRLQSFWFVGGEETGGRWKT